MKDLTQKCKDCGVEFTLAEKDVRWFKQRGLHTPKRCEACRKLNRNKIADGHYSLGQIKNKEPR